MIPYNINPEKYVTVVIDGRPQTHLKGKDDQDEDTKKFNKILEFIRLDDEAGLVDYLESFKKTVETAYNGVFRVENGVVFVKNDDGSEDSVPHTLGNRIKQFAELGLPWQPLVAFWNRLNQNPSNDSVNRLFDFLDKYQHPILVDGRFLAYRKVRRHADGHLYDIFTGKVLNDMGEKPRMKRNQVDEDHSVDCSKGYHAAAYNYAATTYGTSTDVLTEVAVCPSDVVSIPKEYAGQKMRLCGYEVLKEIDTQDLDQSHYVSPVSSNNEENDEDPEEFDDFDNEEEDCENCGETPFDCECDLEDDDEEDDDY